MKRKENTSQQVNIFEAVTISELTDRESLWEEGKYDGADCLICKVEDGNKISNDYYIVVDNRKGSFYTAEVDTWEKAVNWINENGGLRKR